MLTDANEIRRENVEGVKSADKRHFEACFEESINNRSTLVGINFKQISYEENVSLMMSFTEEEIKAEVQNCDGDKSRGPDVLILDLSKNVGNF